MKTSVRLCFALLCTWALPAAGQSSLSTYIATDGMSEARPHIGATLARHWGPAALRGGISVDAALVGLADSEVRPGVPAARGWTADLDAMLRTPRWGLPAAPYLLAGVGMRGEGDGDIRVWQPTWSAGLGAELPVVAGLALLAEARFRQPLEAEPVVQDANGWQLRAGLSLRLPAGRPRARPASLPAPVLGMPAATAGASTASAGMRRALATEALSAGAEHLGVPYVWGGNTPRQGFDCSGFVRYVFRGLGIDLPRVSRDQARVGAPLPLDIGSLEPGDLLAFASSGNRVDHIAIYAGNGQILHSSSSGGGVRYDDLHSDRGRWYREHWVAARRVL